MSRVAVHFFYRSLLPKSGSYNSSGTHDAFSTSMAASINVKNMFKRKSPKGNPDASKSATDSNVDVPPIDRSQARLEITKSRNLGNYEKAALTSITDKGLGKTILPYNPPADTEDRMRRVFSELIGNFSNDEMWKTRFFDRAVKFKFLTECEKVFQYTIPNSLLHQMTCVGEVLKFYLTPVSGSNGLTQFENMDLPKNMHVIYEPYIFHPDTDPYFGGVSAFPHRSWYVSGDLKSKKIYKDKGFAARMDWPRSIDPEPRLRSPWPNPYIERDKYQ